MNLGAILHLNGKLQEAEANYLKALQLKPDDTITQSNLRKLWNIMEKQGLRTTNPWNPHSLPTVLPQYPSLVLLPTKSTVTRPGVKGWLLIHDAIQS